MAKTRHTPEPATPAFPHPRENAALFGHEESERAFLNTYRAGRLHHAWLIGGPSGIGKATLAYRLARFVLAHPDPSAEDVQQAADLSLSPLHAVSHQIALGVHPDCHGVEQDEEKSRKIIGVDLIRDMIQQMQNTSGGGGWRVAIIDSVDVLNANAANALLKILEEPPPRCLFLLVAHQPGRVMPTLRSRCQRLMLAPLKADDLAKALHSVAPEILPEQIEDILPFAHGSVRAALDLMKGSALAERQALTSLLEALPHMDIKAVQQFAELLSRKGDETFTEAVGQIAHWCHELVQAQPEDGRAALFAAYTARLLSQAGTASIFNLDRKSFVIAQLNQLARLVPAREAA